MDMVLEWIEWFHCTSMAAVLHLEESHESGRSLALVDGSSLRLFMESPYGLDMIAITGRSYILPLVCDQWDDTLPSSPLPHQITVSRWSIKSQYTDGDHSNRSPPTLCVCRVLIGCCRWYFFMINPLLSPWARKVQPVIENTEESLRYKSAVRITRTPLCVINPPILSHFWSVLP